jgi:hypothetical protein
MPRRVSILLLLIAAGLVFSVSVSAQVVRITVSDQGSGGPVAGAMVRVENAEGVLVRAGFTNGRGVVRLRTGAGRFAVSAARSGYLPGRARVEVAEGEMVLEMLLVASPLALDTLRVVADADGPEMGRQTFERRRASGIGVFLDSAYVAQKRATWPGDLLYSVPDVDVFTSARDPYGYRRPATRRGWRCLVTLVDGLPYYGAWPANGPLEQSLRRGDVVAVEVYREFSEVPRELHRYAWGERRCGLVLYWTRLGWRTRALGI